MCITFVYVDSDAASPYKYIIGANRDEFFDRAADPAKQWTEFGHRSTFAGRDREANGTWLGLRAQALLPRPQQALIGPPPKPATCKVDLRVGIITNVRELADGAEGKHSRGALIADFLADNNHDGPAKYGANVVASGDQFNGFNLLLGDAEGMVFVSNRGASATAVERLAPGVHGLSNGTLNGHWPKVVVGKERFAKAVQRHLSAGTTTGEGILIDDVFKVMQDSSQCGTHADLPGVFPPADERALSAVFVKRINLASKGAYGTRSTVVILVRRDGTIAFSEKVFEDERQERVAAARHELIFSPHRRAN